MVDLTIANPKCLICRGTGWDVHGDRPCDCVGRAEEASIPDAPRTRMLNVHEQLALRHVLERMLREVRSTRAVYDADRLASMAARGILPRNTEQLATFTNVGQATAQRILDRILGVVQTKKKGTHQWKNI